MITTYDSTAAFSAALTQYIVSHTIAQDMQDKVAAAASGSLVSVEALFEHVYSMDKADRPADLVEIVAGSAIMFAQWGFLNSGKDGRALGIAKALLRDAGEPAPFGQTWPDASQDPAPLNTPETDQPEAPE